MGRGKAPLPKGAGTANGGDWGIPFIGGLPENGIPPPPGFTRRPSPPLLKGGLGALLFYPLLFDSLSQLEDGRIHRQT